MFAQIRLMAQGWKILAKIIKIKTILRFFELNHFVFMSLIGKSFLVDPCATIIDKAVVWCHPCPWLCFRGGQCDKSNRSQSGQCVDGHVAFLNHCGLPEIWMGDGLCKPIFLIYPTSVTNQPTSEQATDRVLWCGIRLMDGFSGRA